MEVFAIPGVGGIIENTIDGKACLLLQRRCKDKSSFEYGMLEIPAGKVRAFENVFDCLRREVYEETGLNVVHIEGESESQILEHEGYKVLNYTPFASAQNLEGQYPIMVQVFICRAQGDLIQGSNESKDLKWVSLEALGILLSEAPETFYPMHVATLRAYLKAKHVL